MVSIVLESTINHQSGISDSIPRMNMPMVTNSTGACPGVLLDAMIEVGYVQQRVSTEERELQQLYKVC